MQPSGVSTKNQIQTAYESFARETPLVTRGLASILAFSWLICSIFDLNHALANISMFTINRLQLYRLFLAPLVGSTPISLIFGIMKFVSSGKGLEFQMGSTNFGALILTIGGLTNLLFSIFCCSCYYLLGASFTWMLLQSCDIWTIVLGIIALESAHQSNELRQILFRFEVQAKYYPLLLLAFFCLIKGRIDLAYCISIGLGYSIGFGKLEFLKIGHDRRKKYENSFLYRFTQMQGWVVAPIDGRSEVLVRILTSASSLMKLFSICHLS
mmetsp:Transcript_21162/g.29645  ORF Transcript_21162/g.29645 Transcript_21162/m.29645 type:complete len:269 (-) Transcript_21162:435-1241(-)